MVQQNTNQYDVPGAQSFTSQPTAQTSSNQGSGSYAAYAPNPNFNPVYQAGNVPTNFTGTYRSAETGQDITLNGGQPTSTPNAVDTSQPSPKPTSVTPTLGSNTQSIPYAQALQNLQQGGLKGNDLANATQSLKQKYGTALSNAQSSGQSAPTSPGEGSAGVQSNLPPPATPQYDSTKADTVLSDNQAHQQYLSDYAASQSSAAQTESLTQTYSDLSNQLGIQSLDTQLMNMKNIMDGSEQDIRDEVTKAGGFATNSQVLAMTDARNKTMIQNYNNLLQTKQDAEQNLTTMMDLTEKDRAYAQQKISDQLNFDQQNIQYADKALTNAQDALKTMQSSEGWDGIYKAALATGDPQAIQKINSTMGQGFDLGTMAKLDAVARAQTAQDTALKTQQLQATIANTQATTAKTIAETQAANDKKLEDAGLPNPAKANQPGFTSTGIKLNNQNASQQIISNWTGQQAFDPNGGKIPPQFYNQAKSWWVQQLLPSSDFDSIFGGYKNTTLDKQKLYN